MLAAMVAAALSLPASGFQIPSCRCGIGTDPESLGPARSIRDVRDNKSLDQATNADRESCSYAHLQRLGLEGLGR